MNVLMRVVVVLAVGLLGAAGAVAQPLVKSVIQVDPGNTKLVGATFGYRLTYNCSSTSGPCLGAEVIDLLPPEVQFVSTVPASPTGDVAAIQVTPNYMGTGRTRVRFDMIDPLPAGNSGDLIINVRFPNGSTPDGTVATNTADGINLETTPGTFPTPPVNVTAVATVQVNLTKTLQTSPANLDLPEQYRLRISVPNSNGALNLTAIGPVTDTLPPGAVFNGATPAADCQPGCVGTTPATITWSSPCTVPLQPNQNCDLFVNVVFPSATFPSGTNVTNSFVADVTPLGEPSQGVGPGQVTHPVMTFVPNASMGLAKNMAGGTPNPPTLNQTFSYDLVPSNNGNVPLDNLVMIDTLPVEMQVLSVTTGAYNALADFAVGEGVRVSYEKNTALGVFTLWGSSPNTTTNTTLTAPPPGLGAGEYLTRVRWEYGQAQPGMAASTRPLVTGRIVNPDNAGGPVVFGDTIQNCVDTSAVYTAGPTNVNRNSCRSFVLSGPFVQLNPAKDNLSGGGPFNPGQTVSWRLRVRSDSRSSDPVPLEALVATDLLPVDLVFSSWSFDDQGTGLPAPQVFDQIPNFAGTGRTLLRWRWNAGSGDLGVNQQVWLNISTSIRNGAITGSLANDFTLEHDAPGLSQRCTGGTQADALDFDEDGDTAETLCRATGTINVAGIAQLISSKQIDGVCDGGFGSSSAGTLFGGAIDYQLRVQNVGTVPMQNFVLIDILPFVGDTGVRDTLPRGSMWTPELVEPIVSPPGTTVYYSTSGNPCRGEVGGPVGGCDAPAWSTVAPEPITTTRSIKIEFGAQVIFPFDFVTFDLRLGTPGNVPPGQFAYNSFAYQADRADGLGSLAAEPVKVGIEIGTCEAASLGDFVWVDTNGDGIQNEGATGLDGVYVELFIPGADGIPGSLDDIPLSSTVTGPAPSLEPGWYSFPGLAPGNYFVCFHPPATYFPTIQDAGSDDALDSDAHPATLCSPLVNLVADEDDPTIDLGLLPNDPAALGDYVWFDHNADGQQDESVFDGVNGVTVRLWADDGDGTREPGTGDALVASTVTANDIYDRPGYFRFDGLIPGQPYFVEWVLPAAAIGFTTRQVGADPTVDSDAALSDIVVLASGEYNPSFDAGLITNTGVLALGNQVWFDTNNDGVFEPQNGEIGINGVRLALYRDVNNDGEPTLDEYLGVTFSATTSGFAGRYRFDDLAAGNYLVVVEGSNFAGGGALSGLTTSTGNDPAPDPDDDVDGDDNGTNIGALIASLPVTLSVGGEPTSEDGNNSTNLTVDFGFFTEDPGMPAPVYDYGDAPDVGVGVGPYDYQTTALDGGARHLLVASGPWLGTCVDADSGFGQDLDASFDDLFPFGPTLGVCAVAGDDEDGVTFSSGVLLPGDNLDVTVSGGGVGTCELNAWIDWNRNGVFTDAGETISSGSISAGPNLIPVLVPGGATPGPVYARFRCSSVGGLGPAGDAVDGEVEDYRLEVVAQDFGDAPDTYATVLGSNGPRHILDPNNPIRLGTCVDSEANGFPSVGADGDDADPGATRFGLCFDDEDGLSVPVPLAACQVGAVVVSATAPSGALLDAWIDWNGNGTFVDAGEQIATGLAVTNGANVVPVAVPCAAVVGSTQARLRLSSTGVPSFDGPASDGEVEDHLVGILGNDWGDAPAPFPTLFADGGPLHAVTGLRLGSCVEAEVNGQPTGGADGDDLGLGSGTAGTCAVGGDDEDGVVFGAPLAACQAVPVTVTASATGLLSAWIDFNRDGDWGDAGEQVFADVSLVPGGNALLVNVPCTVVPGASVTRWRFSTTPGLGIGGGAPNGEVEDHLVSLLGNDLGDAPASYGTVLANGGPAHAVTGSNLFLGSCVDTEIDGQPNAGANGDDLGPGVATVGVCTGADDEDGVVLPTFVACRSADISVVAGAAGVLDAWIDWNGDGDFLDAGEQVFAGQVVAAGANVLNVAVPCTAVPGTTYSRFRISSAGVGGPGGFAPNGEVEDHVATVHGLDFGDAPDSFGTLFASAGPSHAIDPNTSLYLGSCVDTEVDGVPGPAANGDDLGLGVSTVGTCAGNDDEDGVVFGQLVACKAGTVTVTANTPGLIDAWIDWNGDGDFLDAGEQVFAATAVAGGANVLSLAVPCDAVETDKVSRWRLSSTGGLGSTGPAADGEVEDHVVGSIGSDFGDAPDSYLTSVASGGPSHGVDPASPLFLGACVDTEDDAGAPLDASGDDVSAGAQTVGTCAVAGDDEDGVVFATPVVACQTATVEVVANAPGFLDAWVDFGANGSFEQPGDQIAASLPLVAGVNVFNVSVPCSTVQGGTYSRFRFSAVGGLPVGGTTPTGEVEDHPLVVGAVDFGDAPDTYGTTLVASGPHHGIVPGFSLGAIVDAEVDGQPSVDALGDGADEDGVVIPGGLLVACSSPVLTVTLTNSATVATPRLDAWVDFDGDGTFDEPRDRIASGLALVAGANAVPVNVPCDARSANSYARFRLSSTGVATALGPTFDGEVEDWAVEVRGFDFGDAPDPTFPTLLASNGARHEVFANGNPVLGALVDTEPNGQPHPGALGDDLSGAPDDEDGVSFASVLVPGTTGEVEVTTVTGGELSAWIDFDRDGTWSLAEQIASAQVLAAGATTVAFPVPVGSPEGTAITRFRIAPLATGPIAVTGAVFGGEIEDHPVAVGVEEPLIGAATCLISVTEDGSEFLVTLEVWLGNYGNVALSDVNTAVDLDLAFAGAASWSVESLSSANLTVNGAYDGLVDLDLLASGSTLDPGQLESVELVVRVDAGGFSGPYFVEGLGRGTSPAGVVVTDLSQDGCDPDPNADGDPSDEDEPTGVDLPVSVLEIPTLDQLGLALMAALLALAAVVVRRRRQDLRG